MTFGSKPLGVIPQRPRSSGRTESAFAVGSRVRVTSATAAKQIELLDEGGLPTPLRMSVGVEVVITAWRPRRSAPPRYRVLSADGVEGWIDSAHLQRIPPPPPAPMMKPATPPAPPPKAAAPKTAAKTKAPAAAKVPAAVAKPAAGAKPAVQAKAAVPPKPAPKAARPAGKSPASTARQRQASAAPAKPKTKPKARATAKPKSRPKPKRAR